METDTLREKTGQLTSHLADYADTYMKLGLLKVTEKGSGIASQAITSLLLCGLALFVLLFAGLGLSWWLGNLINNRAGGFLIVAGFYLLLFAIFSVLKRKTLYPYFRNRIIKKTYE